MQIYKLADALLITPYDVPYNGIHVLMSKYNNKKEYSTEEWISKTKINIFNKYLV